MTLMFNAVEFIHRLDKAGLGRDAAEAIAQGIEARNADLATRADIERLAQDLDRKPTKQELDAAIAVMRSDIDKLGQEIDKRATKPELDGAIATASSRQTLQLGVIVGAATAMIIAAIGVIVSIH